jgi:chromosome segregation ATPase
VPSQRVKDALGQVLAKKRGIEEIVRTKQEKEREIQVVEQEQNRLRQNMGNLDRTNDLYLKYVRKMTEQEDRVDVLRQEITALIQKEQAARRELDDFLQQLEVD